jgi:hypothetical protein
MTIYACFPQYVVLLTEQYFFVSEHLNCSRNQLGGFLRMPSFPGRSSSPYMEAKALAFEHAFIAMKSATWKAGVLATPRR